MHEIGEGSGRHRNVPLGPRCRMVPRLSSFLTSFESYSEKTPTAYYFCTDFRATVVDVSCGFLTIIALSTDFAKLFITYPVLQGQVRNDLNKTAFIDAFIT